MSIHVDPDKCTACGLCEPECPFGVITIDDIAVIGEGCNLCGACVEVCEFEAIAITVQKEERDVSAYKGVWVFGEQRGGEIERVTYELINEGRKLADKLGEELSVVVFGSEIGDKAESLLDYGVDKVYLVEDKSLADFQDEPYAKVMSTLIKEYKPEVVLTGASSIGRSFIPKVAIAVKTGLTADCTELDIDTEKRLLLQTRPAFGGNIMATILTPYHRPQMCTVRPHVFKKAESIDGRKGEVIKVNANPEDLISRTKLLDFIKEPGSTVKLEEAEIIISGGRGLGDTANFALLHEFAELTGAAVGASRAAVDSDWISYSHQVGQTGKTVGPKAYIACGISGAIQHRIGMQSSDIIVAINTDPSAPIFDFATYGIVGDYKKVLTALINKIKQG